MKKSVLISIIALIVVVTSFLAYLNRDRIGAYLSNKEWEITESVGAIPLSNYFAINGTAYDLIVVGNNYITGYDSNAKENFDESVSLKSAITDVAGDYCVVGESYGTKIYLINGTEKVWEDEIQGNILEVSVNKNGYVAVVYKQTGYKSLVRIIDPEGKFLFTSYLASTYALDVEISNDNKELAIAEIDADGIKIQSAVKLIDINKAEQESVKKLSLKDNALIVDIEYTDKNKLMILTDSEVNFAENGNLVNIAELSEEYIEFVTIENNKNLITVSKIENGLFDTNYMLNIFERNEGETNKIEYELDALPTIITAQSDSVAILLENEFIVINTNGKLKKRCDIQGNVKAVILFDNGKAAGIVYRDKIEILNI